MNESIFIEKVTIQDYQVILKYVEDFRRGLFPMLDPQKRAFDLMDFAHYYIDQGVFFQAKDHQGNLLGVVGLMPFKDRFEYLNYNGKNAFEVARLFVEPAYRRQGIARELVKQVFSYAKEQHIEVLYLHTHPFLTGAQEFWAAQGFNHFKTTKDGDFTTIHMQLFL
ncbi:GNAT family N-acetyltransferase [Myroides sp. LJL119]